jgi:hypothetical protein
MFPNSLVEGVSIFDVPSITTTMKDVIKNSMLIIGSPMVSENYVYQSCNFNASPQNHKRFFQTLPKIILVFFTGQRQIYIIFQPAGSLNCYFGLDLLPVIHLKQQRWQNVLDILKS